MQKVIFSTAIGTSVTIDDVNTSKDANGYVPLHLLSFEGNSEGYTHDTSERVGFDGAGFYGAKANAKAIEIDIALLPRDGRESTMYDLRRAMLRYFPPGVEGTLKYTNSAGKTYQIEAVVNECPVVEREAGVLCTTKIALTAYTPFWRIKADDIELSAAAGTTQSTTFTAATERKIPALVAITASSAMAGTDTHSAIITLGGQESESYKRISTTLKEPQKSTVSKSGQIQLVSYLLPTDSVEVDWGMLGKFYTNSKGYIDLIKSTSQYIYPGTNTLTVKNNATQGTIEVKLCRFDYVRSI